MKKEYSRNYWAMSIEGAMFMGGIVVLSTSGAVALFINAMTGSNTLIGLAITIQSLFIIFGQLSGAPYVNSIRRLPEFLIKIMASQRIIPILMALPLFFGVGGYTTVAIFLILFACFWFMDGFIVISWGELAARALPLEMRGHMMGMQTTIGGFVSLLTGLLLTWLLATPTLSDNLRYAFVFVLGSLVLYTTIIFMRMVRDPSPNLTPEKMDLKKFYRQIPSIVRQSKPLVTILVARIPSYIGFAAVSFMVVFGVNELLLSDVHASWLVYAGIIGGIVSGVVLGEAGKRYGSKSVVLICNICVVVSLLMAVMLTIVTDLGYIWLFVTCVLASFTASNWIGYFNYFIDIAPAEKRSVYQLVGQLIGIPFSFAGFFMGMVIDRFGYVPMFVVSGIFAIITVLLSLRLLSKRKIYKLVGDVVE